MNDRAWISIFAVALVPSALLASEPRGPNRILQPTGKPASPVERALDAAALARVGRATPQADLLVAAARVAAEASPLPSLRAKRTEGAASEGAKAQLILDPAALLEEAAAVAKAAGQGDLEKHIEALRARPFAAPRVRAHAQTERVASGAADFFEIAFKGGEIAQVGIAGAGVADLDLAILDDEWNVVCASSGDTAREYCAWVPAATGRFRVRVKSQGPSADDYVLATN